MLEAYFETNALCTKTNKFVGEFLKREKMLQAFWGVRSKGVALQPKVLKQKV